MVRPVTGAPEIGLSAAGYTMKDINSFEMEKYNEISSKNEANVWRMTPPTMQNKMTSFKIIPTLDP